MKRAVVVGCVAAGVAIAAAFALTRGEHSVNPHVVRVELRGATRAAEVATGFVVRPGRVVTVAHVLEPGRRLVIRDAGGHSWRGRLLREDQRDDLALVAVEGMRARPAARLARVAAGGSSLRILVRRGSRNVTLPAQLARAIRATLHSPNARPYTRPALELRARVAFGDSGAPVVDREGRVAGVVFARASEAPGTAYAVASTALQRLVEG
jgi:S1-C subfamily serine protease